jgi:hypothetical protein
MRGQPNVSPAERTLVLDAAAGGRGGADHAGDGYDATSRPPMAAYYRSAMVIGAGAPITLATGDMTGGASAPP